jgi:hypothetical protein
MTISKEKNKTCEAFDERMELVPIKNIIDCWCHITERLDDLRLFIQLKPEIDFTMIGCDDVVCSSKKHV